MKSFRLVRTSLQGSLAAAAVLMLASSTGVSAETFASEFFQIGGSSQFSIFSGPSGQGAVQPVQPGSRDALEEEDGVASGSILDFGLEEERSELRPFHGRLGRDLVDLVRLPMTMDRRQWTRLGASVLVVGAVSLLDEEIRNTVHTGNAGSQQFASSIRPLGQEAGLAFLGGSWLAGRAFNRPGLTAMAQDGMEATLLSAGLITPILKGLVGRSRPRHGLGSSSFTGSESFPSGEVTEAFAIASVVAAHSDRKWVRAMSWSLAGLVAWQRIELDGHWASDIVAGAFVGAGTGRWVVRRNRPELRETRRWSMAPMVGKDTYGLGFRIALGSRPQRSPR